MAVRERERRLSMSQVLLLIEGAQMINSATGLSITEIVTVLLGDPGAREEEQSDEAEALRLKLASGDR